MFWFGLIAIVSIALAGFFLWPEIRKAHRNEQALAKGREDIALLADNVSYQLVASFYKALHFLALALLSLLQYLMFVGKIISGKLEKRFGRLINLLKGKEPWHNKKGAVSVYLQQLDNKK